MDWFKCLFCLGVLKDSELVCAASCEHFIHEWCVATMKSINEHRCKLCSKDIVVHSVFKEFDLERSIQVIGIPKMIQKLDEIIEFFKNRDGQSKIMQKNFADISAKFEKLSLEHRALKFENIESHRRLKALELKLEEKREV